MAIPRRRFVEVALVVVLAMSVPLMPAIWSALTTEKPMTAERAARLVHISKAKQVELRNDVLRDLMRCQEMRSRIGDESARSCLEFAELMTKDRMQEIRDLDRRIEELRSYEPR